MDPSANAEDKGIKEIANKIKIEIFSIPSIKNSQIYMNYSSAINSNPHIDLYFHNRFG